jgi:hypothetical protein
MRIAIITAGSRAQQGLGWDKSLSATLFCHRVLNHRREHFQVESPGSRIHIFHTQLNVSATCRHARIDDLGEMS